MRVDIRSHLVYNQRVKENKTMKASRRLEPALSSAPATRTHPSEQDMLETMSDEKFLQDLVESGVSEETIARVRSELKWSGTYE